MKRTALQKSTTLAKGKIASARKSLKKNKKASNFTKQIVLLHHHRDSVTNKKVATILRKEIYELKIFASTAIKTELRKRPISFDEINQLERMANLLALNNISMHKLVTTARQHCTYVTKPVTYPHIELHSTGYEMQIANFKRDALILYQLAPFN